ncbi:hypothetical protein [Paracoccus tegillarcae]|uniref:hypothetical protein n=1 Tax=Paracoccus tegillarcae TaxID=1529068 RepID=UPI0018E677DE|nr:hypothetical protein [Paracoccus tegillarcae]
MSTVYDDKTCADCCIEVSAESAPCRRRMMPNSMFTACHRPDHCQHRAGTRSGKSVDRRSGRHPFPAAATANLIAVSTSDAMAQAAEQGYRSPLVHYRKHKRLRTGPQGEKSAPSSNTAPLKSRSETGEEKTIGYAKAYRVFNADQIDGLPEEFQGKPVEARASLHRNRPGT